MIGTRIQELSVMVSTVDNHVLIPHDVEVSKEDNLTDTNFLVGIYIDISAIE